MGAVRVGGADAEMGDAARHHPLPVPAEQVFRAGVGVVARAVVARLLRQVEAEGGAAAACASRGRVQLLDTSQQRLIALEKSLGARALRLVAVESQKGLGAGSSQELGNKARRLTGAAAARPQAVLRHACLGRVLHMVVGVAEVVSRVKQHTARHFNRCRVPV
eukprot:7388328-Prymnesium_polylepis.1